MEFTGGATHRFEHMPKDIEAEVAQAVLAGLAQDRHRKPEDVEDVGE
ncbi:MULTISPECIES: hypothetical protein [Mycobacterium]|nr:MULTISPECIES: hypothetical protein [Mycobacterium]MDP7729666.1 hypothetical protein [Mycobacterium sp. TY813]